MSAHFVNDPADVVTEALDGLVAAAGPGRLARLDGYPDVKVVLRADHRSDRVAVVSGGGAGHEPAHAGFVGPGLLTAAVSGDVFASPSVDAVLSGVLAVTGEPGCLLVVKDYTGDRLNFGLAAERARAAGLRVEVVVVGDDVALPDVATPRGLAGTLLVHKVAGALAERGADLAEVAAAARRVADTVRTIGVSASVAEIPGRDAERRFAPGTVELGLGIHGEPGAETFRLGTSAELVARMCSAVDPAVDPAVDLAAGGASGEVAVLVNSLGGLAPLEASVVTRDVLDTPLGRRARLLIGPAPLMTSLSMRGFSVTALPLDGPDGALLVEALRAPVAGWTAWPGVRELTPGPAAGAGERAHGDPHVGGRAAGPVPDRITVRARPALPGSDPVPASDDPAVRAVLVAVAEALTGARAELDALDSRVGDGDTGSTFAAAARRVLAELDGLPLADRPALYARISQLLGSAMGGSSGVLLSILFAGAAAADPAPGRESASVGDALAAGAAAVSEHGGAAEGDRTMLDALLPAVRALRTDGSEAAARAADGGARATAAMGTARAGRAAYVGREHLDGVEDPGARAVALAIAAAVTALSAAEG